MSEKKKLLSLPMAIALVVGSMIGSGIFLLPATMGPYGGVSALAWLFTATGAMLLAVTFSWLARTVAPAGGLYGYTKLAFGDFGAFLVAWSYWVNLWLTVAALAVGTASNLSGAVPALAQSPVLAAGTALAAVWLITAVNLQGVRSAGQFQLWVTLVKLLPLLVLMLMGVSHMSGAHFTPFNPTDKTLPQATSAAAALALWAMLGLESATVATAKVVDPERNVGRATLWGTGIAAVITAAVCVGAMAIVPPATLAKSNAPFAEVANAVWGGGAAFIAICGAFSAFGCINGYVLMQGQLPQAMARDGLFPKAAERESARGVPAFGIVLGSLLASVMIVFNSSQTLIGLFTFLTLLATLATLVPYLFCTMAAFVLLRKGPVPLTPARSIVLGAAFLYALWTVYGAGQETVFWGFLLLLSGLPVYVWIRR